MFDGYNRRITYLRISVTDRCNLRCIYCMPPQGVLLREKTHFLSYEDIIKIVRVAAGLGISKVRITGGEPLVRKDIGQLIHRIKVVQGVREVAITTNGVLLVSQAFELKRSGLDRINVSLDTLDPHKYRFLTRGGDLNRVLKGIQAIQNAGFENTKINMVVIPGFNDNEMNVIAQFCRSQGLQLQRINHYSLHELSETGQRYEAERPLSCEKCNRIRLTADGKLKSCLFSDIEFPVDFNDIAASLHKAINHKPEKSLKCTVRGNWEIGG